MDRDKTDNKLDDRNKMETVLRAENIEKQFNQDNGLIDRFLNDDSKVRAVDDISMRVNEGDSIGIIGESGCGKTTLLHTLLGLHDPTEGKIYHRGKDTAEFTDSEWKKFRNDIQVVFQDPFNSLDPKMTVREALNEPLNIHGINDSYRRINETLRMVELKPADVYLDKYPSELSGGEKQRVSIARALILDPSVVVADEPVSMLDVSTQAALLNLLSELTKDRGISLIYVTHDLSTVSHVCEEVNVMYLGRIVESGSTNTIMNNPKHPYTQALIKAVPIPDPTQDRKRVNIDGEVGDPIDIGDGCRFKDRCPERMDICDKSPAMVQIGDNHHTACHLYYDQDQRHTDNITFSNESNTRKDSNTPVHQSESKEGV